MDATYLIQMRNVNQLMDLKKAHCACEVHQADREINLLYQLRLPNASTNRDVIRRVLQEMPHGFSAVISSCQQIIGTAVACELHLYEVVPTEAGTFEAVKKSCVKQPHDTIMTFLVHLLCMYAVTRKDSIPSLVFLLM